MNSLFKQRTSSLVFYSIFLLMLSCKGKKEEDIPAGKRYPLENFRVEITGQTLGEASVFVNYDVKNISSTDYAFLNYDYNYHIRLRVTIVATDGTIYEKAPLVDDIQSGSTVASNTTIDFSAGKTIDLSKTKFELIYKR